MQLIENYAEHDFDFITAEGLEPDEMTDGAAGKKTGRVSAKSLRDRVIKIPRCTYEVTNKNGGDKKKVPGRIEVKDEVLKAMQEHPVAKGWFGDGQLAIGVSRQAQREANRKAAEAAGAKA